MDLSTMDIVKIAWDGFKNNWELCAVILAILPKVAPNRYLYDYSYKAGKFLRAISFEWSANIEDKTKLGQFKSYIMNGITAVFQGLSDSFVGLKNSNPYKTKK